MKSGTKKTILVTGGAGYVGSMLVPALLEKGYSVHVIDLFIYGENNYRELQKNPVLKIFKGDIRNIELLQKAMLNVDTVVHLACISNDPSFELNPALGKSINLDAFRPLVEMSRECNVGRFINASSSSVYGVKEEPIVHESVELEPLTDYSKYKAECENILAEYQSEEFTTVSVRPATVCGYSPRQRLDVVVNILTNHAYTNGKIKVFGGEQKRPNIHIKDMVNVYLKLVEAPSQMIAGKTWNAGGKNHTVNDLANIVKSCFKDEIQIEKHETDDPRSYHISSEKIYRELGFIPQYGIIDAVEELKNAMATGLLTETFSNPLYFNIETMKNHILE